MEFNVHRKLVNQGFINQEIKTELFMNLRYEGTNCSLMCSAKGKDKKGMRNTNIMQDFCDNFVKRQDFIND